MFVGEESVFPKLGQSEKTLHGGNVWAGCQGGDTAGQNVTGRWGLLCHS